MDSALKIAAAADLLFALGLIAGVRLPVVRVGQWQQLAIAFILCLLLAANAAFYAGALGHLDRGIPWGLYAGLYLVLALVGMARRFFDPPRLLVPAFDLIAAGALIRIVVPIFDASGYRLWIATSQVLWMLGFGAFATAYIPILIQPRMDGRRG